MTYDEIRRELRKAENLVQAGDVAAGDATIRAMVGRGLTGADLTASLDPGTMRKLRAYAKKKR